MARTARTPKKAASQNQVNFTNNPKDGREFKLYIEHGCCDDMRYEDLVEKYPQFLKFRRGYIVQSLRRFCEKFREKIASHMKQGESKLQYFLSYILILLIDDMCMKK